MTQALRKNQPFQAPQFRLKRGAISAFTGLTAKQIATFVFDTALTDSAGVSNKTIAAHGTGVYLPINAVITKVMFHVKTTFTSATDAGTIAVKSEAANDLTTAIAISDVSNPWDAGFKAGIPVDTAATAVFLSAEREIILTVAVEALTAGKLIGFVEYVQSVA